MFDRWVYVRREKSCVDVAARVTTARSGQERLRLNFGGNVVGRNFPGCYGGLLAPRGAGVSGRGFAISDDVLSRSLSVAAELRKGFVDSTTGPWAS